ncbi:MAG: hypothetical protein R6W31_08210 [Bacteroidales bacterium]
MEKVIFGDNQFFAVNHLSDEKSRAQAIRFKDIQSIINVLDSAIDLGIMTFMCTTHDRIGEVCKHIRKNPDRYKGFKIYPCMPYAHKYANAVTDLGILGALKEYLPGNIFSTFARGGVAYVTKDFISMMQLLIDAEMKMFKGIPTPVIFIQNVLVDLILGLGMFEVFFEYDNYIRKKFNAEPGYITMNLSRLLDALESVGIEDPIVCSSINKIGFRMSGGKEMYEQVLQQRKFRPIAMQVLAAGALKPEEAIEYLSRFPKIESVLFGASSKNHIQQTRDLIEHYL